MTALLGRPAAADRALARKLVEDARALSARGQDDAALRLCEQAIRVDPDYLPALETAAPLWLVRRDYKAIIGNFERVTLRFPEYAEAWYTLGYAYRLTGRVDSAIAAYEQYITMRGQEAAPYFGLAMAYKAAGRVADARRAFEGYIERERDPARQPFLDQARRELDALGGPSPGSDRASERERVRGLLDHGKVREAWAELLPLIAAAPWDGALYALLIQAARMHGAE